MSTPQQSPTAAVPSLSTLLRTTVIAVVVAGAILVAFVLPAEYGIDPVGVGRRLGLTEIASPTVTVAEPSTGSGGALVPTARGPIGLYPGEFKMDVYEVVLAPYEYVEYKYRLEKDAAMLYSWSATAPLKHDMHGERAAGSEGPPEETFDKEDRRQASGTLIAPFAGIHGWYWENPGNEPITIRLTSAGYYSSAVEIQSDRTRRTRTLRSIGTLTPLPVPAAPTGSGQ
jgi:hypothetical protein